MGQLAAPHQCRRRQICCALHGLPPRCHFCVLRKPAGSRTRRSRRLVTLITHFPIIRRITSPTLIDRTFPSPLSSGTRRFARIASMLRGSTNSLHSLLFIVAIAEQMLVPDFLKDLQAIIRRNPLQSTPDGPPEPFVFSAASLIISSFIC